MAGGQWLVAVLRDGGLSHHGIWEYCQVLLGHPLHATHRTGWTAAAQAMSGGFEAALAGVLAVMKMHALLP